MCICSFLVSQSGKTHKYLPQLVTDTRERRKVQLVEQPGQKTAGRSPQATKAAPVSTGRPMSADDIQKAKMRALFMQNKHGKTGLSSNGNTGMKNGPSSMSASLSLVSKIHIRPKIEEYKKPVTPPPQVSSNVEGFLDLKKEINSKEPMGGVCIKVQIPWQTPPGTCAFGFSLLVTLMFD